MLEHIMSWGVLPVSLLCFAGIFIIFIVFFWMLLQTKRHPPTPLTDEQLRERMSKINLDLDED
ncbi:hypothetical protein [Basilea psittacipulmonis]|uniref:Uncharacterized protein n=1 Tax=Basilea psittacipulmonis DSM 24701 TaxID=1072685 RepID=A0A077DDF8_9BURK|nr:hypothetical protein [Basilea psittacipulmonis]AIL32890.1 hypothetical protein IX83_05765 [Basilea psittacipulmonis DSM 24701]